MMYSRTLSRDGRKIDSSRRRARVFTLSSCSLSPASEVLISIVLVAMLAGGAILVLPKGTSVPDISGLPGAPPTPPPRIPAARMSTSASTVSAALPGFTVVPMAADFAHVSADAGLRAEAGHGGRVGVVPGGAGGTEEAMHGGEDALRYGMGHGQEDGGSGVVGSLWGSLVRQVGTHGRQDEPAASPSSATSPSRAASPLDCLHLSTFVINDTTRDCGTLLDTPADAHPSAAAAELTTSELVVAELEEEWDRLTIETPACGASGGGPAAAAAAAALQRPYHMQVRRGGPDLAEVHQVFCNASPELLHPFSHLAATPPTGPAPSVLVAGAHSGAVPLLLAHLLDFRVRITALEPDPARFLLAESNLRPLAARGIATSAHALLATYAAVGAAGTAKVATATAAGEGRGGGGAAAWGGGLAGRLRGLGAPEDTVPAVSLPALQDKQESGRFDLVLLRAAGMQPGVLEEDAARRVLCAATCMVVELQDATGDTSTLGAQYQKLLESCSASHGMAEVSRDGAFAVACRQLGHR